MRGRKMGREWVREGVVSLRVVESMLESWGHLLPSWVRGVTWIVWEEMRGERRRAVMYDFRDMMSFVE